MLSPVIAIVILSLVVSLATRTIHLSASNQTTVLTDSAQGTRQHMDSDASPWTVPVPITTSLEAPTFYPYLAPGGPPVKALLLDQSLYNRPPPSC